MLNRKIFQVGKHCRVDFIFCANGDVYQWQEERTATPKARGSCTLVGAEIEVKDDLSSLFLGLLAGKEGGAALRVFA
jgi:hypothetical protein